MTAKEAKLLAYLKARAHNPVPPSFEEMAEYMGVNSRSSIHRMLTSLEAQGKVRKSKAKARSVEVVPDDPFRGISTQAIVDELIRRGVTKL